MIPLNPSQSHTNHTTNSCVLAIVYTMAYNGRMRFEWDDRKNQANHAKHGVWFEEAQTVWADARSAEFFDPEHSDEEDRFLKIGLSTRLSVLLVVFCDREAGATIRIVSARRATRKEQEQYEKGI